MNGLDTQAQTILRERARQLARPLAGIGELNATGAGATSVLVARLGDERATIALDHIIEVYRAAALTPIPGARTPVIGVIAWRGRVLTVVAVTLGLGQGYGPTVAFVMVATPLVIVLAAIYIESSLAESH